MPGISCSCLRILADNARGGASDGAHSDRGEEHRQHSADEYTDKRLHIEQIEVKAEITELIGYRVAKCGDKGDGSERCRTDGKALSGSGGGIAETVESIGALTNNLVLTGHYSYAAGIIRDGAVCVGRKCNAKRGELADRGKSHHRTDRAEYRLFCRLQAKSCRSLPQ